MEALGRWEWCYFNIARNSIYSKVGHFRVVTVVIENIDEVPARETNFHSCNVFEQRAGKCIAEAYFPNPEIRSILDPRTCRYPENRQPVVAICLLTCRIERLIIIIGRCGKNVAEQSS